MTEPLRPPNLLDAAIMADVPPRRCRSCQANCPDRAKFCWMCGLPLTQLGSGPSGPPPPKLIAMVEQQQRDDPLALKLAPLLALPLVVIVIYGLFQYDPFYGWLFSPALAIGALVAVAHQFLVSGLAKPKSGLAKVGIATSSLMVGLIAGAGSFIATILVIAIMLILAVISIITAILEFCQINVR